MTIFHQLMDKEAYRTGTVPSAQSLYDEAQALMFAGADTVGNTLMLGTYYLLKQDDTLGALTKELRRAWPKLHEAPTLKTFEQLPYLTAVIKESLRMSSGVVSGLLRIVPGQGAKIADKAIPGGVSSCVPSHKVKRPTLTQSRRFPDNRIHRQHFRALQPRNLPQPLRIQARTMDWKSWARSMARCLFQRPAIVPGHQLSMDGTSTVVCAFLQEVRHATGRVEPKAVVVQGYVSAVFLG